MLYEFHKHETFIQVNDDVDLDVDLTAKRPPVVEIRLYQTSWVGKSPNEDSNDKLVTTGLVRNHVVLHFGPDAYDHLKSLHEQLGNVLADPAWDKLMKEREEKAKNQEALDVLDRMAQAEGQAKP
jgi:hypothetical protein